MNKIQINPPPSDRKCYRCRKHVDKLKPFGKAGDPLVGDFRGAKLVKTFRTLVEQGSYPELDNILEENDRLMLENNGIWDSSVEKKLTNKFGKNLVDIAFSYDQACNTVNASWECRDCIIK